LVEHGQTDFFLMLATLFALAGAMFALQHGPLRAVLKD
jgi:hypothetical protein